MGGYARSYFSAYRNLESVHRFNNSKPKDRLLHNWPGANAFRHYLEGCFGDERKGVKITPLHQFLLFHLNRLCL
jgi:hypothetical protein